MMLDVEFFLDRDPKHFRWILNFLREGTVESRPSDIFHLEELIIEAKFYKIYTMVDILEQPTMIHQKPHSKGLFFITSFWRTIFPKIALEKNWQYIGVQFHFNSATVTFLSLDLTDPSNMRLTTIQTTDLVQLVSGLTQIAIPGENTVYIEFKWEKTSSAHPQLLIQLRTRWDDFGSHVMKFLLTPSYPLKL